MRVALLVWLLAIAVLCVVLGSMVLLDTATYITTVL